MLIMLMMCELLSCVVVFCREKIVVVFVFIVCGREPCWSTADSQSTGASYFTCQSFITSTLVLGNIA